MKKRYPFISIIIPVKNEGLLIGKCLKSLEKLNYPKNKFEVIISDALSTDNTVKIARSYGAKIVRNESQTVAPGRNVGFLRSKGELIAFSDADCIMDKNWLNRAVKYFGNRDVAGIGGPNLAPKNETAFGKAVRFLFLIGSFISDSVHVADLQEVKIVKSIPGCNAIYAKRALEKVMPADETLLTCDDTEINYKLRKKGYKLLYTPDVLVWHYRRDNPKKFWRQIYRYAIGRVQLSRRHKDSINLIHILAGLAMPIFIFLAIFVFILNPIYLLFLMAAILVLMIAFAGLSLIKERSIKVAINILLAILIFIFAWSLGFLKELMFPIKEAAGK